MSRSILTAPFRIDFSSDLVLISGEMFDKNCASLDIRFRFSGSTLATLENRIKTSLFSHSNFWDHFSVLLSVENKITLNDFSHLNFKSPFLITFYVEIERSIFQPFLRLQYTYLGKSLAAHSKVKNIMKFILFYILLWHVANIRGQFHQHSTSSFYARRSRKRKKAA